MIHLVRHGDAGSPLADLDKDGQRPLTAKGRRQADALAEVFDGLMIDRVISSPALRCRQTVAPIASAFSLEVEIRSALREGTRADRALAALTELVGTETEVVVASHGDVIPDLLRLLARRGVELNGPAGCHKAGRWVVELNADWTGAAHYHPPPPL